MMPEAWAGSFGQVSRAPGAQGLAYDVFRTGALRIRRHIAERLGW